MNLKIITIPNIISMARLLSIFPITQLYFSYQYAHLVILLSIVFISDMIDGEIARRFNMTSKLGGFLDMLSDNIIINYLLLLFVFFPINRSSFNLTYVAMSVLRSLITISLSVNSLISQQRPYKTGFFGQINAFALMYLLILYILATGIPQFAFYYRPTKYLLYIFITLRVFHMLKMLNKGREK